MRRDAAAVASYAAAVRRSLQTPDARSQTRMGWSERWNRL